MKILERTAITITYKKPFIDWNNMLYDELPMEENILGESKTYLVDVIFNDANKLIKKYYKEIFEEELEGICIDESTWPQNRNFKLFNEWFNFKISDIVIDLIEKKSIY